METTGISGNGPGTPEPTALLPLSPDPGPTVEFSLCQNSPGALRQAGTPAQIAIQVDPTDPGQTVEFPCQIWDTDAIPSQAKMIVVVVQDTDLIWTLDAGSHSANAPILMGTARQDLAAVAQPLISCGKTLLRIIIA